MNANAKIGKTCLAFGSATGGNPKPYTPYTAVARATLQKRNHVGHRPASTKKLGMRGTLSTKTENLRNSIAKALAPKRLEHFELSCQPLSFYLRGCPKGEVSGLGFCTERALTNRHMGCANLPGLEPKRRVAQHEGNGVPATKTHSRVPLYLGSHYLAHLDLPNTRKDGFEPPN